MANEAVFRRLENKPYYICSTSEEDQFVMGVVNDGRNILVYDDKPKGIVDVYFDLKILEDFEGVEYFMIKHNHNYRTLSDGEIDGYRDYDAMWSVELREIKAIKYPFREAIKDVFTKYYSWISK